MAQSMKEQKSHYRKRLREAVSKLSKNSIEQQSIVITRKVLKLSVYQQAESVSVFLSMPGKEVSTNDIVLQAFKDGKKVFVPYIHSEKANSKSKVMDMLRLHDEHDLLSLTPDSWGIPSLSVNTIERRENALGGVGLFDQDSTKEQIIPSLDLILVPATGFDQTRSRLGHGKGFYDRYLTMYQDLCSCRDRVNRFPFLVGLALNEQVLGPGEDLPTTDEDWKVDIVINSDLS